VFFDEMPGHHAVWSWRARDRRPARAQALERQHGAVEFAVATRRVSGHAEWLAAARLIKPHVGLRPLIE